jgi:hypothetical protein
MVVFAGPTIDLATVRSYLDAEVHGPVSFGDVYRAAQRRPTAIAIIDGYFDRVAAVWHKEILWAMSQGVHVFGSSSMGALRAAELAEFGMEGIGKIFEAYRSGELEDDEDVAVVHGPAEAGFAVVSEAMVNVRATLRAAAAVGAITSESRRILEALAKTRFYADRTYAALFQDATSAGMDPAQLRALKAWLPGGRVDQKRADAVELLGHLRHWAENRPSPKRVTYPFHATDAWNQATRFAMARPETANGMPSRDLQEVIEELKVDGAYAPTWRAAALRGAAIREGLQANVRPDFGAVRGAVEALRTTLGLMTHESVDRWRAQQQLTEAEAVRFFEDEARFAWALPLMDDLARLHLLDHLRSTGDYGRLVARAEAKKQHLESLGSATPSLDDLSMTDHCLWDWYFEHRLGRPMPSDLDTYARTAGFRDRDELRSAVIRERVFVRARVPAASEESQSRTP